MLLLLHLLMAEGLETKRVLIDTLLEVTPVSQAAICREASVPPSSLSRFRRVDGVGLISEEKQDDILRALGFERGHPREDRVMVWEVDNDIRPVQWLLAHAMTAPTSLACVAPEPEVCGGYQQLAIGRSGHVRLLIRSRQVRLDALFLHPEGVKQVVVESEIVTRLCRRFVSPSDFDAAERSSTSTELSQQSSLALLRQLRTLGMTTEELQALLMRWITRRAQTEGDVLAAKLQALDVLDLDTGRVAPSKMTSAQRSRLVARLARRSVDIGPMRAMKSTAKDASAMQIGQ